MISAPQIEASSPQAFEVEPEKIRRAATSQTPNILTDIYQDETNIAIWQRELSSTLQQTIDEFVIANPTFQSTMTVSPQNALAHLSKMLGPSELSEDIAELMDMFCCLFELKRAGLRLAVLNCAMCPKFHVDKVPCRLVTTYRGLTTQWLPHNVVDRTKLGAGNPSISDEQSALFQCKNDIHHLNCGDVALLKGELWEGNENAGLVHRSPSPSKDELRLLLTLDFSN